ncbi:cyclic nucleotide-gated ion channel [Dongia sp.]|uniref:cyclic nucleotide-gated ion channel n=1 Tax=Dongia sp. TaxID=1977262 RepID=UPI003752416F
MPMGGDGRGRLLHLLDISARDGQVNWPARVGLVIAILLSVGSAAIVTLPDLPAFERFDCQVATAVAGVMFLAEYLWRIWRAPLLDPDLPHARRRYLLSFIGLVDLLSAAPLLGLVMPELADTLLLGQLLSLFKLSRLTPALSLVATVLKSEWRALAAALLVMLVLLVIASGVMYLLERGAQPTVFSSIPRSLWWGIVTMATVGYGDMTPVTPFGRLFGGMVMLLGIAMFAVPAGILATGFATEIRRRDFVVTWNAVARVPLFTGLDATRIAAIARLLKPQIVPERQVVVRRGEPADAMFFIMEGEVEVEIEPPVKLAKGQFFGEVGLLLDTTRNATVAALTETRLLVLDRADFQRLMHQHPDLKARIEAIAAERKR